MDEDKVSSITTVIFEDGQLRETSQNSCVEQLPRGWCEVFLRGTGVSVAIGRSVHDGSILGIDLLNSESKVVSSKAEVMRFQRKDVPKEYAVYSNGNESGFLILFSFDESFAIGHSEAMSIKFRFSNHQSLTLQPQETKNLDRSSLSALLGPWNHRDKLHRTAVLPIYHPILKEVFETEKDCTVKRHDFGEPVENPQISLIIPLFGRIDFMKYQLSNFARYKTLTRAELIYVLDDPSLKSEAWDLSLWLHETFGLNFTLLELEHNVGYARANNIAVEHCRSAWLVLKNSDVLAVDGEWLDRLLKHASTLENLGLLGVRLLYEDGSIQHDGMVPRTLPEFPGVTFNDHPYKGWPEQLVPNTQALEIVDMVTAACVLIRKATFQAVDGFDSHYFLGDFEDSDLCRKVQDYGCTNYIARDVCLFHLERQSQNQVGDLSWKNKLTLLNAVYYQSRLDRVFRATSKERQSRDSLE